MNFSLYDSQEIDPSLVSFEMIFEALESKLFKKECHALTSINMHDQIVTYSSFSKSVYFLIKEQLIGYRRSDCTIIGI